MLNLKEDISAKDVVNAIIKTKSRVNIMKKQFAHNPFVFYRFPSMREIPFKIERYPHVYNASSNRCYGIGFLHVREGYSSALYAVFLLIIQQIFPIHFYLKTKNSFLNSWDAFFF